MGIIGEGCVGFATGRKMRSGGMRERESRGGRMVVRCVERSRRDVDSLQQVSFCTPRCC